MLLPRERGVIVIFGLVDSFSVLKFFLFLASWVIDAFSLNPKIQQARHMTKSKSEKRVWEGWLGLFELRFIYDRALWRKKKIFYRRLTVSHSSRPQKKKLSAPKRDIKKQHKIHPILPRIDNWNWHRFIIFLPLRGGIMLIRSVLSSRAALCVYWPAMSHTGSGNLCSFLLSFFAAGIEKLETRRFILCLASSSWFTTCCQSFLSFSDFHCD